MHNRGTFLKLQNIIRNQRTLSIKLTSLTEKSVESELWLDEQPKNFKATSKNGQMGAKNRW